MEKAWEIVDLRHQKNGKIKIVSGCTDIANVLTRDVDDPMHNAQIIAEAPSLRARVARLEEALKFYAEKDYIEWVTKGSPDEDCYEDVDKGAVARRALEEK